MQDPDALVVGEPGVFLDVSDVACLQQVLSSDTLSTAGTRKRTRKEREMTETVEKQVLPEVKRYTEARAAHLNELHRLRDVADDLYYERHASDEAMEAYQKATAAWRTADNAQDKNLDALAATLAGESEDKLVKFIAENYLDEYPQQAITILE